MLINAINAELESWTSDRDPSQLSISSIGHCARNLAYRYFKVPMNGIDPRGKLILDDGDRGHAQLRALLRRGLLLSKSCYMLMAQELKVTLGTLPGHIDGLLRHRPSCSDSTHQTELLEIKTANDRSFKAAKDGKIEQSYLDQAYGYLSALNLNTVRFLFKNKNTAELYETTRELELGRLNGRLDIIDKIHHVANPEQIPREHVALSTGYLPWQCNYCPFTMICWRHEGVKEVAKKVYKIVTGDKKSHIVL